METTILELMQTDVNPHTPQSSSAAGWVEGAVNVDRLMCIAAGGCSVIAEFGTPVWLDQSWPEDRTERLRTHQAKVNLIPQGTITFKFKHSHSSTSLLSLSTTLLSQEGTCSEANKLLSSYWYHPSSGEPGCWSKPFQLQSCCCVSGHWPLTSLTRYRENRAYKRIYLWRNI